MAIDTIGTMITEHIMLSSILMSYALVFIAEIGDKSQLMCMMLAAKHRALPVVIGAIASFVVLNGLAVTLGASLKELIAPEWISTVVALLFLGFGMHSLMTANNADSDETSTDNISTQRLFFTTFMLITVAEFGDKTQLAVLALGSSDIPLSIFIGATFALTTTTLLGVWAGQHLLRKLPMPLIGKISGSFFIILGLFAAWKAYQLFIPIALTN